MPSFSIRSLVALSTAHEDLQNLFREVIKYRDCTVLVGFRNQADQNKAKAEGNSNDSWPNSPHNRQPSLAVDVAPFINGAVNWKDGNCIAFGGFVMGIAQMMNLGSRIRWGADWDGDRDTTDQRLFDPTHFEIILRPGERA